MVLNSDGSAALIDRATLFGNLGTFIYRVRDLQQDYILYSMAHFTVKSSAACMYEHLI